ncbi:hypothetical protein N1851_012194 [Merluccius polli]|uniref:Uncharacterized protein n=1 Tax=Merluccius polli TaxID=89951 RepID=A0AA47MXY2_MERPO|nr:hypothetical protein N1851_012194 [Merluccius polli]
MYVGSGHAISALLRAIASSRSSCSCCRSLFSRSRSARSLSRLAHSICWASFPNYTHTHSEREREIESERDRDKGSAASTPKGWKGSGGGLQGSLDMLTGVVLPGDRARQRQKSPGSHVVGLMHTLDLRPARKDDISSTSQSQQWQRQKYKNN